MIIDKQKMLWNIKNIVMIANKHLQRNQIPALNNLEGVDIL